MTENDQAPVEAIIVLFESRDDLPALVDGLRAQTSPCSRWIFCLNGPDDGAGAIVEALTEPTILIRRPDNPGFTGGVNAALAVSTAPLVLTLNPDVRLDPDFVANARERFASDPKLGALGGLLRRRNREGEWVVDSAGFRMQPIYRYVDRGAGEPLACFEGVLDVVPGVCAAAAFFRRSALDEVAERGEVMDSRFFMYKEDQDLCLRLGEAGWRVVFDATLRAEHRRGWRPGQRRSISSELRQRSYANRFLLMIKHWRWQRDWLKIPAVLVFDLFLAAYLLISEPATLKGLGHVRRALPGALDSRRRLVGTDDIP